MNAAAEIQKLLDMGPAEGTHISLRAELVRSLLKEMETTDAELLKRSKEFSEVNRALETVRNVSENNRREWRRAEEIAAEGRAYLAEIHFLRKLTAGMALRDQKLMVELADQA